MCENSDLWLQLSVKKSSLLRSSIPTIPQFIFDLTVTKYQYLTDGRFGSVLVQKCTKRLLIFWPTEVRSILELISRYFCSEQVNFGQVRGTLLFPTLGSL